MSIKLNKIMFPLIYIYLFNDVLLHNSHDMLFYEQQQSITIIKIYIYYLISDVKY